MRDIISHSRRAFILLEVMLAIAIFAFAIIGMANALNQMLDVELDSRAEARVRMELESRIAESRIEPIEEGTAELYTDFMGVSYIREITPLELENKDGETISGIFSLKVRAIWNDEEINSAEIYVLQN